MSYHRKEVDKFLDYDSTKINLVMDIMNYNSAEVELQFYDVFNPNDIIIASATVNVEFDEAGELETSSLDILNQDPEFFIAVLQHKYDKDGQGEQVDLEGSYDAMFMEAVAGKVSEDIEHEIKELVNDNQMYFDADEIEIEMEEITVEGNSFRQAFIVNGEQVAFTYEVTTEVDEDMGFYQSYDGEVEEPEYELFTSNDIPENQYSRNKLQEIFEGMDDMESIRNFSELSSKIDEMALDNYKSEIAKPEEPKQKQKKSKGFGMSM